MEERWFRRKDRLDYVKEIRYHGPNASVRESTEVSLQDRRRAGAAWWEKE